MGWLGRGRASCALRRSPVPVFWAEVCSSFRPKAWSAQREWFYVQKNSFPASALPYPIGSLHCTPPQPLRRRTSWCQQKRDRVQVPVCSPSFWNSIPSWTCRVWISVWYLLSSSVQLEPEASGAGNSELDKETGALEGKRGNGFAEQSAHSSNLQDSRPGIFLRFQAHHTLHGP